MTLIASSTVGSGGASTITFSSIPATYTDLVVKLSGRNSGTGGTYNSVFLSINGTPSGTLHSFKTIYTIGTTVGSNGASGTSSIVVGVTPLSDSTTNTFSNTEIYFPNYTTSNNKSLSSDSVMENNTSTNGAIFNNLTAGLWASSSVISSLVLTSDSSSFLQFSTAYLYGIKNS